MTTWRSWSQSGVGVFWAVSAWSRVRFVRFAADEKATTTLGYIAETGLYWGAAESLQLARRHGFAHLEHLGLNASTAEVLLTVTSRSTRNLKSGRSLARAATQQRCPQT